MTVDADGESPEGGDDLGDRRAHLRGQRRAVGVAQHDALGAGLGGRAQARQRVVAVVAPTVEEMLGVVEHALALPGQERHRVGDHRQVLFAVDAHDLVEVQRPGLAHQRAHRCEAVGQQPQRRVLRGTDVAPARHAERRDLGDGERLVREQLEELGLLGVRRREARLDHVDAELVQLVRHAHLLGGGQGHPLALHPVAQGRVVQLHGGVAYATRSEVSATS